MVEIDLQFFLGLIPGAIAVYLVFKYRLKQVRVAVDAVDDAVEDDKVTEVEFRKIWDALKAIIYG